MPKIDEAISVSAFLARLNNSATTQQQEENKQTDKPEPAAATAAAAAAAADDNDDDKLRGSKSLAVVAPSELYQSKFADKSAFLHKRDGYSASQDFDDRKAVSPTKPAFIKQQRSETACQPHVHVAEINKHIEPHTYSLNLLDSKKTGKGLSALKLEVLARQREVLKQKDYANTASQAYLDQIVDDFKAGLSASDAFPNANPDASVIPTTPTPTGQLETQSIEADLVNPPSDNVPATATFPVSPDVSIDMATSPFALEASTFLSETIKEDEERTQVTENDCVHESDLVEGGMSDSVPEIVQNLVEADVKLSIHDEAVEDGAAREHAKYFKSWGKPEGRHKPKSRIRKVILTRLPPASSLTFVQSLIHGGSIDTMTTNQHGTIAYVTFTDGDACDKFYDQYPNGIVFKIRGRDNTVFVDKAQDVDVISGVLEGYLLAGASRVVRVVNADEDWSTKALRTIAEGAQSQRRVESIHDSYCNDVRTIIFRFASISDAVVFRNSLRRSVEWEFADVHFIMDPCEKATGVHFE